MNELVFRLSAGWTSARNAMLVVAVVGVLVTGEIAALVLANDPHAPLLFLGFPVATAAPFVLLALLFDRLAGRAWVDAERRAIRFSGGAEIPFADVAAVAFRSDVWRSSRGPDSVFLVVEIVLRSRKHVGLLRTFDVGRGRMLGRQIAAGLGAEIVDETKPPYRVDHGRTLLARLARTDRPAEVAAPAGVDAEEHEGRVVLRTARLPTWPVHALVAFFAGIGIVLSVSAAWWAGAPAYLLAAALVLLRRRYAGRVLRELVLDASGITVAPSGTHVSWDELAAVDVFPVQNGEQLLLETTTGEAPRFFTRAGEWLGARILRFAWERAHAFAGYRR